MPTPVQIFYWKVFYTDGSSVSQFDEDTGEERLFYTAVLSPENIIKYEEIKKQFSTLRQEEKRQKSAELALKNWDFRNDIIRAGWFKITTKIAITNPNTKRPFILRKKFILDYSPGEKPFLMRENKWNYQRMLAPETVLYKIGRDGKTEWTIDRSGRVRPYGR